MKRTFILSAIFMFFTAIIFTSCQPSQVWANKERNDRNQRPVYPSPSPRYYSSAPLIISPTPGFRMSQYPDGRFVHRSPQGYLYWKGFDNRFYLDRNYLSRINYSKWEYKEWKRYSKQNNRR